VGGSHPVAGATGGSARKLILESERNASERRLVTPDGPLTRSDMR
jgi:hypothetical protein